MQGFNHTYWGGVFQGLCEGLLEAPDVPQDYKDLIKKTIEERDAAYAAYLKELDDE